MLTADRAPVVHPPGCQASVYWCTATAYPHSPGRAIVLSSCPVDSALLAVRWIRRLLTNILDQIDETTLTQEASSARDWLKDTTAPDQTMRSLLVGEPVDLCLLDDDAYYVIAIRQPAGLSVRSHGRGAPRWSRR